MPHRGHCEDPCARKYVSDEFGERSAIANIRMGNGVCDVAKAAPASRSKPQALEQRLEVGGLGCAGKDREDSMPEAPIQQSPGARKAGCEIG
jgi:hypothetical protein